MSSLHQLNSLSFEIQSIADRLDRLLTSSEYARLSESIRQKTQITPKSAVVMLNSVQLAIQGLLREDRDSPAAQESQNAEFYSAGTSNGQNVNWKKPADAPMFGTVAHLAPETVRENQQLQFLIETAAPIFASLIVADTVLRELHGRSVRNADAEAELRKQAITQALLLFDDARKEVVERNKK